MSNKPRFVGEKVRLGDVCKASSLRNKDESCNTVYSVTNSQGFVPSEEYFSKEVYSKELKTYRVVDRDMIAYNPSRINVGSVALQNKAERVVVSPLYVVFSTDSSRLLPDYLVQFLKSKPGLDQIAFQSIGTVRNNLKFKAMCQMELTLPSVEAQRKRLQKLDSICGQINHAKETIEKLDQLVKSRFVEMFGNSKFGLIPLEECCDFIAGGSTPSMKHEEFYGGNVPFIKSGDVKGDVVMRGAISLTEAALQKGGAKLIPADSVLVVTRSALLKTRMHTALAPIPVVINQDIKAFHPKETFTSNYLMSAIREREQDLLHGVRSVNTSSIKTSDLYSLPIPVPPLELQQEFADFAAQVDKSRFVAQQQIEKLQMLYDSLAQDYFGD